MPDPLFRVDYDIQRKFLRNESVTEWPQLQAIAGANTVQWIGSASTLARFDVTPDTPLTPENLDTVRKGRAVGTARHGPPVRPWAEVTIPARIPWGATGLDHGSFRFAAPDEVRAAWRAADVAGRTAIEAALMEAATQTFERYTLDNPVADMPGASPDAPARAAPAVGFAGYAYVVAETEAHRTWLWVDGWAVGFERTDGTIAGPSRRQLLRKEPVRQADLVGRHALNEALAARGVAIQRPAHAAGALLATSTAVSAGDADGLQRTAKQYTTHGPAVWLGSPETLGTYGARPGAPVSTEDLVAALGGRAIGASDADPPLRTPARVVTEAPLELVVEDGLEHLHVSFFLPEAVALRYAAGDPAERARVEQATFDAVHSAIVQLTASVPGRDYAAAAQIRLLTPPGKLPIVTVSAVAVGVRGTDGKLVAPIAADLDSTQRAAEEVALSSVEQALSARGSATAREPIAEPSAPELLAQLRPTPFLGPDSLRPHALALGHARFTLLDHQIEQTRTFLAGVSQAELERRYEDELRRHRPFEAFNPGAASFANRFRAEREAAEQKERSAGSREEARNWGDRAEALARKERSIKDHPDRWVGEYGAAARRLVALERELRARWEQAVTAEAERVRERPPPEIEERLGPAPERSSPHREDWANLTRRLVGQRLAEQAERRLGRAGALESARERLDADVRQWRIAHELEQPMRDVAAPGVGW